MKSRSTFLFVLRLSLTLLLITSVMAAMLALVDRVTAPIIAAANERKTQEAIEAVLPGGGQPIDYTDASGTVRKVYASDAGYAVQVAPSGFDGEIDMMVGIDKDGKVLGISIISHTETAGLGAVAAADNAKGEAFRGQFVGMGGTLALEKDGGEVDAITGATITSRAVTAGIDAALRCVETLGQGG